MSGMIGLRNIRKAKNLYQQKVAMDLNITREALSHYENGRREPTLAMLVRMSEYFHVSIDYLITGKEFEEDDPRREVSGGDHCFLRKFNFPHPA